LIGVFVGGWMRGKEPRQVVRGLVIGAVVGLALGMLWNPWFPINKNLWTSSYVLFAAGFAMAVLAACYWLVDVRGWKLWAHPFVWFGVNPLAIYFLASWLGKASVTHKIGGLNLKTIVYGRVFAHMYANPYIDSLAFAMSYVLLFWIVAWLLYRRKIFVRV
jgi:predicted acyltransferase